MKCSQIRDTESQALCGTWDLKVKLICNPPQHKFQLDSFPLPHHCFYCFLHGNIYFELFPVFRHQNDLDQNCICSPGSCLSRAFCWCCVHQPPSLFLLGAPVRPHFPGSPVVWWSQSNEEGSNGHHHQPAAWPFGQPLQSSMLSPSLACCLEEEDALEEPGSRLQSTASPLSRFAQWPEQEMSFYMWGL